MHVHATGANPGPFIAYGVTSVRDTGGSLPGLGALEDRGETTGDPVPRYFVSGEIFEGVRSFWGDAFLMIRNEEDARAYVRRFGERGARFIKVYPSLSWPLKRAVADEARRLGLPVVGHGMGLDEIVKSALATALFHRLSPRAASLATLLSLPQPRGGQPGPLRPRDPAGALPGATGLPSVQRSCSR
jgi:hypothetical protein